jgi:hypothetical protein
MGDHREKPSLVTSTHCSSILQFKKKSTLKGIMIEISVIIHYKVCIFVTNTFDNVLVEL